MVVHFEGTGILMSLIYYPPADIAPDELMWQDTQIQWQGLLMGMDTFFGYKKLTGWDDLPGSSSADSDRPRAHGEFAGRMLANGRIITFDTQIWGVNEKDGSFAELRREFIRRTQITQEETPLVIQQHGERMMCFARVVNRSWPIDRPYFLGYPQASVQWKATDPRKYSVDENQLVLLVPSSAGGLPWDTGLDWDTGLTWGDVVSGTGAIMNAGVADTPVRIEFTGPLTAPYYVNAPGNWTLGFGLDLEASDTLIADARLGTVTLGGIDRYYTLRSDSDLPEDCLAPEGPTTVQFITGSPSDTGNATIYWRDAQM